MQASASRPITRSEIEARIMSYLKIQGYQVVKAAKIIGKSGVEHTFDLLAQADEYLVSYNIAISLALNVQKDSIGNIIFDFSNQAYDAGINQRILVTDADPDDKARDLAQQRRIRIIDTSQIESLHKVLAPKHAFYTGAKEDVIIESKEQLAKSLIQYGYRVDENARVKGRSGVDYTFDILAYHDIDNFGYSLGIDFLEEAVEVNLEQVSFFDTKAYDTGTDQKVIVIKSSLSAEANQFARQQHIQVYRIKSGTVESGNVPTVSLNDTVNALVKSPDVQLSPQPEALQLIPEIMARRYNAIPLTISGNTLEIAMEDPTNIFALEAFEALTQKLIKTVPSSKKDVRDAIDLNYKGYSEIEKQIAHIHIPTGGIDDNTVAIEAATYTPLVQALNMIIEEAGKARASDIHFEPEENRLRIRYRIDGTLQDMISLPLNVHRALISRIKILAGMNIADSHRPQDGQFTTTTKGRPLDIRVATSPTIYGETAVLRLLDKSVALLALSELGFLPDALAKYEKMLKVPFGMILVGGPTGSGKTTTLYASVNTLDSMKRNIITIEDPAESHLKDITQIQVNPQAGLTFATGLRSILRLDPDVILIGEIRDGETAGIAVQAALTGHTMLSSIHANETTGALVRLIDLGIEPFMIASSVVGIVSQRMVRRICPNCQHNIEAPILEQIAYEEEIGEKRAKFPYGTGCKNCSYTGYRGRIGVYEVLSMSNAMKTMLYHRASNDEMRIQALKEGMVTMLNDGMNKVKMGVTTPAEVVRAVYTTSLSK